MQKKLLKSWQPDIDKPILDNASSGPHVLHLLVQQYNFNFTTRFSLLPIYKEAFQAIIYLIDSLYYDIPKQHVKVPNISFCIDKRLP